MAGVSLLQAQTQLDAWIAASIAVAAGQSFSMGERSLTLVNAKEIREQIDYWDAKVNAFERTSGRQIKGITPC